MSLRIEFELDTNDWLAFQKFHYLNSSKYLKTKLIVQFSIPVVFGIFILIDILKGKPIKPFSVIFYGLTGVIWAILYPKRFDKNNIRRFRKQIETGDNSGILGKQIIEFGENGILSSNPNSETKVKWEGIKDVKETDEYYFLYNSAISALIIPKNKNESSLVGIDEFLTKKLDHSPTETL